MPTPKTERKLGRNARRKRKAEERWLTALVEAKRLEQRALEQRIAAGLAVLDWSLESEAKR